VSKAQGDRGFTLIEMLISMSMGLVIIAGIAMVFVSNGKTSSTMTSRSGRMGDLFLASHLMQEGLRESLSVALTGTKSVTNNLSSRGVTSIPNYPASFSTLPFWDSASKTLTYQDLEGNVGIFHYQHKSGGKTQKDKIYWLRPIPVGASGATNFQELIRDLDTTNGLQVSPVNGGVTVTLQSRYNNEQHQSKVLSLSFSLWPRN